VVDVASARGADEVSEAAGSVAVWPLASVAMSVLRQKRSFPSASGTLIATAQQFTVKICPVSAFSACAPSGLNARGSRQVPVQMGVGSIFAPACVSLYETSVRCDVAEPSMLGSQRVFQKTSLPLKKARWTPAPRAASAAARSSADQYSS
jgi:hypothetical protein